MIRQGTLFFASLVAISFLLSPFVAAGEIAEDPLEALPYLQDFRSSQDLAFVSLAAPDQSLVTFPACACERWVVRESWFSRHLSPARGPAEPSAKSEIPGPQMVSPAAGGLSLAPGGWVLVQIDESSLLRLDRFQVGFEDGAVNLEARKEMVRRVLWRDKVVSWVLIREDASLPIKVYSPERVAPPVQLFADERLLMDLSQDPDRFHWVEYGLDETGKVSLTPVFLGIKQNAKAGGKTVNEDIKYTLRPQNGLALLRGTDESYLNSGWLKTDLLPGEYELTLSPKTCQQPDKPFALTLRPDGKLTIEPALELKRGLSLEGMVMDPAGAPVVDAVVSLTMDRVLKRGDGEMRMTLGTREVTTNEDGTYLLAGLLKAHWLLQVKHPEFPVYRKKYADPVDRQDVFLEYGSVLDIRLPEGIHEAMAELTPPSVTMEDYFPGRELVLDLDEQGNTGPLPSGSYALFVKAPRYQLVRQDIDLAPGRNLLVEPDWKPLAVVRIHFQNPLGAPLAGVQVNNPFLPQAPGWPLMSDQEGEVVLPDLPSGSSTLNALWAGASYRVDIPAGDPERATEVVAVIAAPGTVLVQVSPAVRGMADLTVALIPFSQALGAPQQSSWMMGGNQMSSVMAEGKNLAEGQGQVRLGPAAPGDYLVAITPQEEQGAPLARQTIRIQSDTEVPLHMEVKLPRVVNLVAFSGEDGEGAWRFGPGQSGVITQRNAVQVPNDAEHLIFWPDALYRDGALMVMSRDQLILPLSIFAEQDTWTCPSGRLSMAPSSGTERIEVRSLDWPGLVATAHRQDSLVFDLLPSGQYQVEYFSEQDQSLFLETLEVN